MKTLTATPKDRIATPWPLVHNPAHGELLAERWGTWTVNLSRAKS